MRNAVERHGRQALPSPALTVQLSNEIQTGANFWAFQKTFSGNFSFDVFFDSASTPHGSHLDSASLSAALEASKRAYDERFEKSLGLRKKGFSEKMVDFARELTASMIGGVGYYFGQSIVDRSFAHEYDAAIGSGALDVDQKGEPDPRLTEPEALFTATPSRSMFPRGFYWDEGFHLAVIGAWDNDLSLDILKSWIGLIDEDGWVAREQILGEEARSRVPTQFQTQYPTYANPPTLIMAVTRFIDRLSARGDFSLGDPALDGSQAQMAFDSESSGSSSPSVGDPEGLSSRYLQDPLLARAFLRSIYAPLRTHYLWFRRTQRGEIKEWERSASARNEAFRWRGRTRDHVLTSGLDDYPRAEVPHSGELHVDLMAWMGFFADTMRKVARAVGETDDEEEYERNYRGIVTNLEGGFAFFLARMSRTF